MFSDFCLWSLLICIIVIIGDRPTGLYYNFCLSILLILYSCNAILTLGLQAYIWILMLNFGEIAVGARPSKGRSSVWQLCQWWFQVEVYKEDVSSLLMMW